MDSLHSELEARIDPEYKARVRDHYNMDVSRFMGVRTPDIRAIAAAQYRTVRKAPIEELLDRCDALLQKEIHEYKIIAFDWSYRSRKRLGPEHFALLEYWLEQYVDDWIDCDDFCTHTLGAFLVAYPDFLDQVKVWTTSQNRWVRRASAVSLIYGLRRGTHLDEAFDIARALFDDQDDLVQKGCGWVLKEASKKHADAVFDYVMTWREAMPRTVLRYAVERLRDEQRQEALARHGVRGIPGGRA
ncbi:MAG: DNA alkylation repair protein [Rhodothermales bacterium]|nr:DNA alkylation repair protein [Rhodothermales bacterium]